MYVGPGMYVYICMYVCMYVQTHIPQSCILHHKQLTFSLGELYGLYSFPDPCMPSVRHFLFCWWEHTNLKQAQETFINTSVPEWPWNDSYMSIQWHYQIQINTSGRNNENNNHRVFFSMITSTVVRMLNVHIKCCTTGKDNI